MNRPFDEEAAIATDAYIDLLLDRGRPTPTTGAHEGAILPKLRATIDLLHDGLPRFHPSFTFEQELAERLTGTGAGRTGELIRLRLRQPTLPPARVGRRVLLGGAAIASGVSVAAVYAWRHAVRRGRLARSSTEVTV